MQDMKFRTLCLYISFSLTMSSIIIAQTGPGSITAVVTNQSSFDCVDGSVDLTISNAFAPYTIEWSTGETSEDISGLQLGIYCVTVTDEFCGEATDCYNVLFSFHRIVAASISNISVCDATGQDPRQGGNGTCDGAIDIEVFGDVQGPFNYQWVGPSFSSNDEDITGLCVPGLYSVTVTNNDGCIIGSKTFEICCCSIDDEEINPQNITLCFDPTLGGQTNVSIDGALVISPNTASSFDGQIDIQVSGGNSNYYTFTWQGPGSAFPAYTEDITNLGPGQYTVTVTDGCSSATATYQLIDCESGFPVSGVIENTCYPHYTGEQNNYGVIDLSVLGGNPPYSYNWSNGSINEDAINLGEGEWCVTVTDVNGCSGEGCFSVGIQNYTESRTNCVTTWYCHGDPIDDLDIGSYTQPDPLDCEVLQYVCNDGVVYDTEEIGTRIEYEEDASCLAFETCILTGDIVDVHQGTQKTKTLSGYDAGANCWYCWDIEYCEWQIAGQNTNIYVYSSVSALAWSITTNQGCSPNCFISIYCGPLTNLIASGCSECIVNTCVNPFGVAPNINEIITKEIVNNELVEVHRLEGELEAEMTMELLIQHKLIDPKSRLVNSGFESIGIKTEPTIHDDQFNRSRDIEDVKVFPNPFTDQLFLQFSSKEDEIRVALDAIDGRNVVNSYLEVLQGPNRQKIDIPNEISSGLYLLKLYTKKGEFIYRQLIIKI
jgi:Secretion system C-terminal sorting domain/SprB repeat